MENSKCGSNKDKENVYMRGRSHHSPRGETNTEADTDTDTEADTDTETETETEI